MSLSEMDLGAEGDVVQVLPACNLNDLRKPLSIWLCSSGCPNSIFGDFTGKVRRKCQWYHSTSGFYYPTYISDRENNIMWFLYFSSHCNFMFASRPKHFPFNICPSPTSCLHSLNVEKPQKLHFLQINPIRILHF